jgi:hypothetical protein
MIRAPSDSVHINDFGNGGRGLDKKIGQIEDYDFIKYKICYFKSLNSFTKGISQNLTLFLASLVSFDLNGLFLNDK